jgi:hypothetical protein
MCACVGGEGGHWGVAACVKGLLGGSGVCERSKGGWGILTWEGYEKGSPPPSRLASFYQVGRPFLPLYTLAPKRRPSQQKLPRPPPSPWPPCARGRRPLPPLLAASKTPRTAPPQKLPPHLCAGLLVNRVGGVPLDVGVNDGYHLAAPGRDVVLLGFETGFERRV